MSDTRLSPGDTAPDFTLTSDTGEQVSLSGLRGRKVIVYFYPAAMTPGCTKQACDFTDSLDSLKARRLRGARHLPRQAGQAGEVPRARRPDVPAAVRPGQAVLEAYGAFGEKKLYGKTVEGVIRSTFVVDEEGKVEQAQYNVKATGHVAKLAPGPGSATPRRGHPSNCGSARP